MGENCGLIGGLGEMVHKAWEEPFAGGDAAGGVVFGHG